MKKVLITGSTGMIGNRVLNECLNAKEIGKVMAINRHSINMKHPKLKEIIHQDFTDFSTVSKDFENIDIAYYCIGVYTGAVPRDQFRVITVDFAKAFAKQLKKSSPNAIFCLVSAAGADRSEKSRFMFAQDKGAAENIILSCKFPKTYIFRPGYIHPSQPRKDPNFSYTIWKILYSVLKFLIRNSAITSKELGRFVFTTGLHGGSKTLYENRDMRNIIDG